MMRTSLRLFVFFVAVSCFWLAGAQAVQNEQNWGLLGTVEFPLKNISSIPKWKTILQRIKNEEYKYAACDANASNCDSREMAEWRQFIRSLKGLDKKSQIEKVNRYANKWPYKTDNRVWGKSDFWATPIEFMKFSGDCEDYSIFKYVTLKALGFDTEHLRLVVVKDVVRNLAHAILAVYTEEEIYILDSLFDTPLPHRQVLQYSPYYSITETTRFTHAKPLGKSGGGTAVPSVSRSRVSFGEMNNRNETRTRYRSNIGSW